SPCSTYVDARGDRRGDDIRFGRRRLGTGRSAGRDRPGQGSPRAGGVRCGPARPDARDELGGDRPCVGREQTGATQTFRKGGLTTGIPAPATRTTPPARHPRAEPAPAAPRGQGGTHRVAVSGGGDARRAPGP